MRQRALLILIMLLSACSGGAVVFAPTPPPPDLSPLLYQHPGGAFSVRVPRNWSVYVQNLTTLASASFAPPGEDEPVLRLAVINLGEHVESERLAEVMNLYQTQFRPNASRYKEADRQAMGDGSWRLTGLQAMAGGVTLSLNTFIQAAGTLVGVAEVVIPTDPIRLRELQTIVNSFTPQENTTLQPTEADALAYAANNHLDILHVSTWTTPSGVFFITGEVANTGSMVLTDIPVRAVLHTPDGLAVAEAVDTVMGYGILPGGFSPFSLRFGQGQPALTDSYEIMLGGADWKSDSERVVYGPDELIWTDSSELGANGQLLITGTLTNISTTAVKEPLAVVTIFNADQNVIAAGFAPVSPALAPGESTSFEITIPEIGGQAANYILNVQGLPAS